jgi:hypothetical protein
MAHEKAQEAGAAFLGLISRRQAGPYKSNRLWKNLAHTGGAHEKAQDCGNMQHWAETNGAGRNLAASPSLGKARVVLPGISLYRQLMVMGLARLCR